MKNARSACSSACSRARALARALARVRSLLRCALDEPYEHGNDGFEMSQGVVGELRRDVATPLCDLEPRDDFDR